MENNYLAIINSSSERGESDFYATSPAAVEWLLKYEKFTSTVLEPCCGSGNIAKVLKSKGYEVIASDLYDRGYGVCGVDFLDEQNEFINGIAGQTDIVSNFPYRSAFQMVKRSFDVAKNKVAVLFPLTYLPRFHFAPPTKVYVFTRRIDIARNGDFEQYNAKAIDFAWYVWYLGRRDLTQIHYIDNSIRTTSRIKEYQEFYGNVNTWNGTKSELKQHIKQLYEEGVPKREIARIAGVSESTVRKWLKQEQ